MLGRKTLPIAHVIGGYCIATGPPNPGIRASRTFRIHFLDGASEEVHFARPYSSAAGTATLSLM